MKQLDKIIRNLRVTVYGPTPARTAWRVNVEDVETGDVGRMFAGSEAAALEIVDMIADGFTPDGLELN